MRILAATIGVITLVVLAALTVMFAGIYDVSAAWQDPAPLRWVLGRVDIRQAR
jgi:hypothetical protein